MERDITLYLADIVANIDDAVQFVTGMTYGQFVDDKKTVNAVVRSIEVIGEATKHVPLEIRVRRSNVPWKDMAGMRDKCIHGYMGIDYEVVWTAVQDELPNIRIQVQSLLVELVKIAKGLP